MKYQESSKQSKQEQLRKEIAMSENVLGLRLGGVLTGGANGTKLRKKVKILSVYTNFS